jgi:site-specific recombinase XerD
MDQPTPLLDLEEGYLRRHAARGSSPATIVRYQQTFKLFHRFAEGVPLDSRLLTTETMQRFAIWLRETPTKPQKGETRRSEVSVHGHLKDLRAFLHYLADEELLARPVKVTLPKLPQRLFPILSEADLERVWRSSYLAGSGDLCVRNRALIGLMLDTGLRRAEVASLTLASLDLENRLLTVIGKGDKERKVAFSHNVRQLLDAWLARRGPDEGSLFWLSGAGIRTTFRRIEAETGIPAFYPHQVRHTAASIMVRNNIDPFTLQHILGHADLATTQRYVTQSDEDLRAKHAAASPFDTMLRLQLEAQPPRRKRLSRTG